jgi:pimeloyl-ACP methyl ester carboxylesterase
MAQQLQAPGPTTSSGRAIGSAESIQRRLRRPWTLGGGDRRLAVAVAVGTPAATGALVALVMPRGPITALHALAVVLLGVLVGVVAGVTLRSRWAMLLAPVVHVAVFELGRIGAEGPTVDRIGLSGMALLALVLGRGVHGLLGLVPMVLGAAYGAGLARRSRAAPGANGALRRAGRYAGRGVAALTTVAMVALAVAVAWPAATPPILGADGNPLPGSIAELTRVELGGVEQAVLLRGQSVDNPVLLQLHGGPGGANLGSVRAMLGDLEEDFVVVGWDQAGAGKSYGALEPTSALTVDRMVDDTIELTNYLRERFDEERIYILGESWGSTLGVLAASRHPQLYHAFVGSGQMVDQLETDLRLYQQALEHIERTGDTAMEASITAVGEPPWDRITGNALDLAGHVERLGTPYTPPAAYAERGAPLGPVSVRASEYSLIEKVNVVRGLFDTFAVLYPRVQGEIDLRVMAPQLDVPVYLIEGRYEHPARYDLAVEWFQLLDAPRRQLFTLDRAGHAVAFERFDETHRIMTTIVLPETYPGG